MFRVEFGFWGSDMGWFSIQTISAVVEVVTGGPGMGQQRESIGLYRTGNELELFLGAAGIELHLSMKSRVKAVRDAIIRENESESPNNLICLLEQVCDPRAYIDTAKDTANIADYLNKFLKADGYELRSSRGQYKLTSLTAVGKAAETLKKAVDLLSFDSVNKDFDRAIAQADTDPEGAITSACSTVESVCKCILDELKTSYPAKQDISSLVKAVQKELNLSPARTDIEPEIKQILQGLLSCAHGIGTLRTHAGSAHGRGKGFEKIDSRLSRLAIHAASSISLFFIETFQKQQKKKA